MNTIYATLPRNMEIDGTTHVEHWRTKHFIVYQNYTLPVASPVNPCNPGPQIAGQSLFHVYQVVNTNPGESLGQELATFTELQAAMNFVAKEEEFP